MAILGKDKIHYTEKGILYTPIMVGVFIALSVWGKGLTFGFMGIGWILMGVVLDSIKKKVGNNRRFVPPLYSIPFYNSYSVLFGNRQRLLGYDLHVARYCFDI